MAWQRSLITAWPPERTKIIEIAAATANYYQFPFERALEIITGSGVRRIELALYWEHKQWAMAQHLRGVPPAGIARAVRQSGLELAAVHDGGGVLPYPYRLDDYVNPALPALLDALGYAPRFLVFHPPQAEGASDPGWWKTLAAGIGDLLGGFRADGTIVTLENLPPFGGYAVPLLAPQELADFTAAHGLGVTLDTTHYAQVGLDVPEAAGVLAGQVRTLHLSDYRAGATHVFPGAGELRFDSLFAALAGSGLQLATLECCPALPGEEYLDMPAALLSRRLAQAAARLDGWLTSAGLPTAP
ncbi:MAG: sugar phosphate isomerase/epimerase family protein [Anaerolineae bacterium]